MTLLEIFEQLSGAEFSQLDLGGGDVGINPRDYPRLTRAINTGLAALHEDFFLKEGELTVTFVADTYRYLLHSDYADSNTYSSATKYINDTAALPFEDDLLKIERIYDDARVGHDVPYKIPLNEVDNVYSIRTPNYRTIIVPDWTDDEDSSMVRRIVYRANHRKLLEEDWDVAEDTEVDLPYSYLTALCYWIASRILTPLGGSREGGHDGNNYALKYQAEVQRLKGSGASVVDQDHNADKFTYRGFA